MIFPIQGWNPHFLHLLPCQEAAAAAKSLLSCPTPCDPIDGSEPSSPIPGILQARVLEWVAISSSRGSSRSRVGLHISFISCLGRRILY